MDLAEQIRYLTPDQTVFTKTTGRLLQVQAGSDEPSLVYLHCSFPHTNSRSYISVRTADNVEIGIIRSLDDFPEATVKLLEEQIDMRYYAPKITAIYSIKDEFGYSTWETETTAGRCSFTTRAGGNNIRMATAVKMLIHDVNGDRYIVENVNELTVKEQRLVEMYL